MTACRPSASLPPGRPRIGSLTGCRSTGSRWSPASSPSPAGPRPCRGCGPGRRPGLSGRVVEIGFGSGFNVPHYPDDGGPGAGRRTVGHGIRAWPASGSRRPPSRSSRSAWTGRSLPLDDASCDGAICTFALCTIPDPEAALAEVRRVLRARRAVPPPRARPGPRPQGGGLPAPGRAPPAPDRRRLPPDPRPGRPGSAAGFVVEEVDQRYGAGPEGVGLPDPGGHGAGVTGGHVADERLEPARDGRLDAAESVLAIQDLKARYAAAGRRPLRQRGPSVGRHALDDLARRAADLFYRGRGVGRRARRSAWPGAGPRSPPGWPRPPSCSRATSSCTPRIAVDGDRATGRWELLSPCTRPDGTSLWMAGAEDDTYRRVDGAWLHASMTLTTVLRLAGRRAAGRRSWPDGRTPEPGPARTARRPGNHVVVVHRAARSGRGAGGAVRRGDRPPG